MELSLETINSSKAWRKTRIPCRRPTVVPWSYGAYGAGAYAMPPPPNPYAAMAPNPYAPYGFAAAPPKIPRPDAAALAAFGLSQAQIEAAMAAADCDSSDDEE